jgi:hypothetical protein
MTTKILDILLGLFCTVAGWLAFPLVPVALLFAKRYYNPWEEPYRTQSDLPRLRLRWPFRWLETPNEPLPGNPDDAQVRVDYLRHGWYWTSLNWLWRNRALRLAFKFGRFVDEYTVASDNCVVYSPSDVRVWRYQKSFGPLTLECGWRIQRATPAHKPLIATPFLALRRIVTAQAKDPEQTRSLKPAGMP